ncbi:hypothetical protein N7475_001192 [Penicillium sp. IBT 31633x]|nr:hypothetical protein N7475_001192 [Penicillium sp. IBT 31633x]
MLLKAAINEVDRILAEKKQQEEHEQKTTRRDRERRISQSAPYYSFRGATCTGCCHCCEQALK